MRNILDTTKTPFLSSFFSVNEVPDNALSALLSDADQGLASTKSERRLQETSDLKQTVDWILRTCDNHLGVDQSSEMRRLADLGCGTGSLAVLLATHAFQICAIDQSSAMLDELVAKCELLSEKERARLQIMQGDIVNYRFADKQDVLIALTDSLNHVPAEAMHELFLTAAFNLRNGGLFLFDLLQESFLASERGNQTFFAELPDGDELPAVSLIWENRWQPETKTAVSDLTFFERRKDSDVYLRSTDRIVEYYHDLNTIQYLWHDQFETIDVRDEEDRRIFVLRRL